MVRSVIPFLSVRIRFRSTMGMNASPAACSPIPAQKLSRDVWFECPEHRRFADRQRSRGLASGAIRGDNSMCGATEAPARHLRGIGRNACQYDRGPTSRNGASASRHGIPEARAAEDSRSRSSAVHRSHRPGFEQHVCQACMTEISDNLEPGNT
jgi:hypothetical protein